MFTADPGRRLGCSRPSRSRPGAASPTCSTSAWCAGPRAGGARPCVHRARRRGRARRQQRRRHRAMSSARATPTPARPPRRVFRARLARRRPRGAQCTLGSRASRSRSGAAARLPVAVLLRGDLRVVDTGQPALRRARVGEGDRDEAWRLKLRHRLPAGATRCSRARCWPTAWPRPASRAPTTRASRSASADDARGAAAHGRSPSRPQAAEQRVEIARGVVATRAGGDGAEHADETSRSVASSSGRISPLRWPAATIGSRMASVRSVIASRTPVRKVVLGEGFEEPAVAAVQARAASRNPATVCPGVSAACSTRRRRRP